MQPIGAARCRPGHRGRHQRGAGPLGHRRLGHARPPRARRTSPRKAASRAATWPPRWPRPTWSSSTPTACRWSIRAISSRTPRSPTVDPHGRITIWSSTQGSFPTRAEVADVLDIPEARIKVIPMECGGGFGGKIRALVEPLAVLLSRATGRPGVADHDPPRRAAGGHARAGRHHPTEDGRQEGRHAAGARGRDHPRSGRFLGRAADDERRLPGQRVPVAGVRRARLRGPDQQAERGRLSRATGAADRLRQRFAHGHHRPQARPGSCRVQGALPAARRRPDGQRPAVGRQRRRRVPARCSPSTGLARTRRLARKRRQATVTGCAAPAWPSAAGCPTSSRPARRCAWIPTAA